MLVRTVGCLALVLAAAAPAAAQSNCQQTVSDSMSRTTEKLNTRYQRVSKRMETQGRNPKLIAEKCRIARALEPALSEQIAAIRESGCTRDPKIGPMVTDIVRGHEEDLAAVRKATGSLCN